VTLLDGATAASTRGGTRVRLTGANFGLPSLIQSVRYGKTGREYAAANVTYVSHEEVRLVLARHPPSHLIAPDAI